MSDTSVIDSLISLLLIILLVVFAGAILFIYLSPAFKKNVNIMVSYIYLKLIETFYSG